jgi:hypothetical protein
MKSMARKTGDEVAFLAIRISPIHLCKRRRTIKFGFYITTFHDGQVFSVFPQDIPQKNHFSAKKKTTS